MQSKVEGLFIGTPKPFRGDSASAIARDPAEGPVELGWTGFEGDQVADPVHHGGWDKAIHLYPQDHYDWWRERKPGHPLFDAPGAFAVGGDASLPQPLLRVQGVDDALAWPLPMLWRWR